LEATATQVILESMRPELKSHSVQREQLKRVLDHIQIFGFGHFNIAGTSGKSTLIQSQNNPVAEDYRVVFGVQKICVDRFATYLLSAAFREYFAQSVEVTEIACKAKGDPACIYKVTLK
jgi:hypothetical protein